VRPLSEPGVQFNDWSRDCGRRLWPKIAGPEARAARERPPLRGLENIRNYAADGSTDGRLYRSLYRTFARPSLSSTLPTRYLERVAVEQDGGLLL